MKTSDIRKKFLDYFERNGHTLVPSSGLVPKGDPTLLFTNAGMVRFKGVLLGEEKCDYVRAASCQKCMRAGGKHSDLENVGRTARHHTFFEMLGNFSFGDYFKEGAIEFAWEFLTREMGLPEEKLYATVFTEDDEAAELWKKKTGLPKERIVRLGEEDNFWSMGDTGPCGPCSEILIDQGEELGCGKPTCRPGCDCDRYLEIWNLVFMQYDRDAAGKLTPLPSPSIDTGMGLERLAAVMQGVKSNYETDLFIPIIELIEKLTAVKYEYGRSPTDVSIRAVADHSRATAFLITDGILPSNEGRGYVLRRIIRRAARHIRLLKPGEPLLYRINEKVVELMSGTYPELKNARELIMKATRAEEERFLETLDKGLAILEEEVGGLKKKGETVVPGPALFKLYDTYGFPMDLTADIVEKEGFTVDEEGFNTAMEEQRQKARKAWKGSAEPGGSAEPRGSGEPGGEVGAETIYSELSAAGVASSFVGYQMEAASSRVTCIIKDGKRVESASAGEKVGIITEETPFYGESGGQAGDTGAIVASGLLIKVTDTKRPAEDLVTHHSVVEEGTVSIGDEIELVPDMDRRNSIRRNHTATHILHAALRESFGEHVRQAGSLVTPAGLRFDFNHFSAITDEEIRTIEQKANIVVRANIEVETEVLPYEQALQKGALAFFGDKYADTVRMVSIPGMSAELCGGTHVKRTGEIGLIKVRSESSVASGTRRIEALTGEAALQAVSETEELLGLCAAALKVGKSELPDRIRKLLERQKELEKEATKLKGRKKAESATELIGRARTVDGVKVLAVRVESGGAKELRETADALRAKLGSGIVVLGSSQDGKALLLAAVTKDLTARFSAGEIVKRLAPVVGGKGGGRADMAQAGGKSPEKIDEAVETA
ncbi:MAG: alanine--tRNA ligase, partial [Thermodesulfobacteriota bacterium]